MHTAEHEITTASHPLEPLSADEIEAAAEDNGEVRPVLHRASLSEMFIPYGDPSPTHYRKNVFDMGEAGIGMLANSLELGCDCLGEIYYFDGFVNDNQGRAMRIANAICMHEEDYGVLWKHTDYRSGKGEVRRSRRLVISMFTTVGNYDYGFFWYFYQDGSIEYEVKLTGIISNGSLPDGERPGYGTLVAPGVYGPNHQHIFVYDIVSIGIVLAILNAVIAQVLGFGRILYSSGRDRAWPGPVSHWVSAVHPRFRSPWVATVLLGVVGVVMCLSVSLTTLANLTGASLVVDYALIAIAALVARLTGATARGSYKMPLWPLPPILALAALGYVFTQQTRLLIVVTLITMGIGLVYWAIVILPQRGRAWNLREAAVDETETTAVENARPVQ